MPDIDDASKIAAPATPPDALERSRALNPERSFLVQAPAGSGKTYLLVQRFLRLLSRAERPDAIVAITFTNAAAAEMRQRILEQLEKADLAFHANPSNPPHASPETLDSLAALAMERARAGGWQILDQPHQLRITTIDAFCRELALKSPLSWGLLSSLGGRLEPELYPEDLYRQAARRTLQALEGGDSAPRRSVEALMRWRDNGWSNVESLIVEMLKVRTRWHQEFVFARDADWEGLRKRLEAPFLNSAQRKLAALGQLLDGLEGSRAFALELIQFACRNGGKFAPMGLADCAEFPGWKCPDEAEDSAAWLEDAVSIYYKLANFLLTSSRSWRKKGGLNVHHGFPATPEGRAQKDRFGQFVDGLAQEPQLEAALGAFVGVLPVRYSEEEWQIVRHCFAVLREAYAHLQLVFAETGSVDFTEVSRIALEVLVDQDGSPSDLAIREADSIRHLLIDEFQDTSRNQHLLLSRLISAWPEHEGRSLFCVGDPMQSIYGFRDAEVELFERVKTLGVEPTSFHPDVQALRLDFVELRANFRTVPTLLQDLNTHFERIFAEDDGSSVRFSAALAARGAGASNAHAVTELHLAFTRSGKSSAASEDQHSPESTRRQQLDAMVALIRERLDEASRQAVSRSRIAVLGRKKASLVLAAEALRAAGIGYRAIELVKLNERPEVLDVLSLARALLNPVDRTAWLGVLRAPWCGLSLAELHALTSADDSSVMTAAIPVLLAERLEPLFRRGELDNRAYLACIRVRDVLRDAASARAAGSLTLGTWLESVWKALGGEATVNAEERENLRVLWTALDGLADGEVDLLGQGLATALDHLFALPDPAASPEFGVQLMTIHKSKGLEFEIVLVPDLENSGSQSEHGLMNWLERGVADAGEPTEFLIAPIQTKGSDAGPAKTWVQAVKRERETQELRRLLYVAATRAREELHLFARPRFKEKSGARGIERTLESPKGLLATAWPALGDAIEDRFADWKADIEAQESQQPVALAAGADAGTLLHMPPPASSRPTRLRRLPETYIAPALPSGKPTPDRISELASPEGPLYARTEGGLHSRLLGTAIHALLERLSQLHQAESSNADAELAQELPRLEADMRSRGLTAQVARKLAAEALEVARKTAAHPLGAWILAPHPRAVSEPRWTGVIGGAQSNVRPDRVFLAAYGEAPGQCMQDAIWWIVDYKTSHGSYNVANDDAQKAFLAQHWEQHKEQLGVYAEVLRSLETAKGVSAVSPLRIRTGLYYPRLGLFDWREA